jgi:hypothetical protein
MGDAAGHLAQGAQTFLLDDRLLGLAQFLIGRLQFLARIGLIEKTAALFLGRKDFQLELALSELID